MNRLVRSYVFPLLLLLLSLGVVETAHGQEQATKEPAAQPLPAAATPQKPKMADWEKSIDDAFGKALDWTAFLPFYNVGPLFGIPGDRQPILDSEGRPHYERDAEGNLLYETDPDGKPLRDANGDKIPRKKYQLGPDRKPVKYEVPFVVLWLVVAAVLFTLMMRFVNVRLFGHAIAVVRGRYDNPADQGEVTHFQALAAALSATVGLGNIAGVAIAVSIGGPGATFWMVVAGLLGMTLKFTECTLGQRYRRVDDNGQVSGGPMHYLRDGLERRGLGALGAILAMLFTVFCIGGSLAGGNAFQVFQSKEILADQMPFFRDNGWVYGVVMATMVGVVIIGGIKRIAQTAEKIVPTMCGIYVLACLTILIADAAQIPTAFATILNNAFAGEAMYGGALGALIMGFRRAAFSNEAGVGSAAIAHSAAKTPYPVREGIVALLEPFIDTVVVCTMTALVIVITGVYQPGVATPQGMFDAAQVASIQDMIAEKKGASLTNVAFSTVPFLAAWFPYVLTVAVMLFAFSTMISWSYYGERCWSNLFPGSSMAYKILFLAFVVLGSIMSGKNALEFGDLMILLMAIPNILGLYLLNGEVRKELAQYETDLKAGKFPVYDK